MNALGAAFLAGVAVGVAGVLALVWWVRRSDPIVGMCVHLGRWRGDELMSWVPVDQMDVGDSCLLQVTARKKSGRLVPLAPAEYTAADGTYVEIVDGTVTAREEGLADILVTFAANPAIFASVQLAVADPVMALEVRLGREVSEPE